MKSVLVTRPAGRADELVWQLETRGYRAVAVPMVTTRPLPVDWPDLYAYDWIVVTSAAAVDAMPSVRTRARWAAVGEASASALRSRGAEPDFVPATTSGAALGSTLPDPRGAKVLFVRGTLADPVLGATLRVRGALVDEVTCYESIEGPSSSEAALRAAIEEGLDAVIFASGSAVRGYVRLGGTLDLPAVTIGPRTTAAARAAGFNFVFEAARQDVAELVAAVERGVGVKLRRDA